MGRASAPARCPAPIRITVATPWAAEPASRPARLSIMRIPPRPHARTLIAAAAVLALAVLAGCGSRSGASGSGHSPAAPPAATTLTVADNGKTVRLPLGQSLAVRLDPAGGMSWHLPATDGAALRPASASGGYPRRGPALATFAAIAPGRVKLHSITDAACLHSQPACALAQRSWQVTVVVARSSATP
jgi:hypothetical protein